MSTNIEIENKALISKDEYQKLINYYSKYNCTYIEQTNYYIDTINKDLIRLGLSLRIRNIANDYELTLKQKLKEG
ncbi:MAG: CYTH domain-containing protein, partial [Bacilli bacterium]|nr:CYTH domain-containing protein [Bacilli bacterium]